MMELEKHIMSLEPTMTLHYRSRGPYPRVVDSTDLVENGERQYSFYFVRAKDLDSVITEEIKTQGYWSIDQMFSPVVEYLRSGFDGKMIRPGRLYYNDSYYDESGKLVGKTPGFDIWAKKLLSTARILFKYDKKLFAYVGENVKKKM